LRNIFPGRPLPADQLFVGKLLPGKLFLGKQGYVDIFEDLPGGNAKNAVGGFDQIIAFAAGVLTAKRIGECEGGGELLGFDQKTGAIGNPWAAGFHVFYPDFLISRRMIDGERMLMNAIPTRAGLCLGTNSKFIFL
jgi:hypothetical protein